ncbi:ABC transporter ATP-binding protein [Hartmannibacter diazotrophicus]|uniref:ABC transporter ATP-binding protein n=1 Tax=Hartmannibacter diazotrophicus TaxID=1482074 RepID=UPI000C155BA9|nr:ATP-binding cassette domain-containing protein [Hartmannibacter diazotrophicus]
MLAVQGLSLALQPGSFTALIGPSGCGKTTTLRILAGLDHAYKGEVHLPADTRIGYVFQEPRLLPWRTVDQNVRLVLPTPDANDPASLYAALGISDMTQRFPTELSLGLARRVSIARALVIDPNLLLLDEPSTSLDETTAQKLRALILEVWLGRRTTTLLVTHNIREAIQLADRLVLLSRRPSHVLAEIALDTPHQERGEDFIEAKRQELMVRFPETIA